MIAAAQGYTEIIDILTTEAAIRDNNGMSALMYAAASIQPAAVKSLVQVAGLIKQQDN